VKEMYARRHIPLGHGYFFYIGECPCVRKVAKDKQNSKYKGKFLNLII